MAFFGRLKLGLDLEMRAAYPTKNSKGYPPPGAIHNVLRLRGEVVTDVVCALRKQHKMNLIFKLGRLRPDINLASCVCSAHYT